MKLIERELKKTDDAIKWLGDYLADTLPTMDKQKLITLMRMCYQRGVLVHTLETERIHEMLSKGDEDDC